MAIGQDLHFDVARPVDEFFHVETGVTEGGLGLALGCAEQGFKLLGRGDKAHAPSTATSCGLDHHRISHRFGQSGCGLRRVQQTLTAWDGGHPYPLHRVLSSGFVSHGSDRFRRGSDKGDGVGLANFSEIGVLR